MTFDELLALVSSSDAPRVRIDSRLVAPGDIFVAVKGTTYDGHNFINHALANGAKYIVSGRPCDTEDATVFIVDNPAKAAAALAQASKGEPASQLINLAVTGTNGKTTVAYLVRSVVTAAGLKCGLIGTVVYDTAEQSCEAILTTPDCLTIAELTEKMLKAGAKYTVIEASSHALAQDRLAALQFTAAAFTNLAGDHLDYHKTKAVYLAAKTKLFEELSLDATAVLNKQSPQAEYIAKKTKARILWYAVGEPADITAHIESMDINRTIFTLEYGGESRKVVSALLGRFNVSNHLAAAGLCLAAGFDLHSVADGLSALRTIPGRLEKVDWDGDFSVFIDYAHTEDALKNVLSTLKPACRGKLRVVFGCGGDRDRTKRPRMAAVAERLADFVVVTSDNPRTEQPEDIINEIVAGFENPDSKRITVESDRKKAIELAIKTADKNDIVLIAGKGHENYQIIGKQKLDFSDKAIAEQCLKRQK
jgi:UDP-N-acetylmuramoyl-L-alanyl-D-glutamate--2,6-diaminopimelate ligase